MRIKLFLFVASCIMLIAALFHLPKKLKKYKIEQAGKAVFMKIVRYPKDCDKIKGKIFMEVEYDSTFYFKEIQYRYCKAHKMGDMVQVKYVEGESMVLFPDESTIGDFCIMAFFAIAALSFIIYYLFPRKRYVVRTFDIWEFPNLRDDQVALMKIDTKTRNKLNKNFQKAKRDDKVYDVFPDMERAVEAAKKIVQEHRNVECSIFDKDKIIMALIDKNWASKVNKS